MNNLDNTPAPSALNDTVTSTLPAIDPATTEDAAIRAVHKVGYFNEYDTAVPLPEVSGFRPVKCLYKINPTTKVAAGANSYIYIVDAITEDAVKERLAEFLPYFVNYLQEQENEIIKGLHKSGSVYLADNATGIDTVLERLEASGTGNRLNKEKIEAWFDTSMSGKLAEAFAAKMGVSDTSTDAELEKLQGIIDTYKRKFSGLASGKVIYRAEEAEVMQKALTVTGADESMIGSRFVARLERMKKVDDNSLLLAL